MSRDRYVPLLLRWPRGKTYRRLQEEFGWVGVVLWTNYLIACKQNDPEGRLEYTTETEGWFKLGMGDELTPDFTLDAFFKVTGRLKKTTKRRVGHRTEVVCTRWGDHNQAWRTQQAAERKARNRQETKRDTDVTDAGQPRDRVPLARAEAEAEKETALLAEQKRSKTTSSANGTHTTALPDESISELHQLGAEIERRLGAAAPPHTLEGILALIPLEHRDDSTPTTISRAIEPLTLHQRELLHDEVLSAGPEIRNRGKYAVKIAQRLEREGSVR